MMLFQRGSLSLRAVRAMALATVFAACTQAFAAKSTFAIFNVTQCQPLALEWIPDTVEAQVPEYTLTLTPFSPQRGVAYNQKAFRVSHTDMGDQDTEFVLLRNRHWLVCEVESEAKQLPPIRLKWGFLGNGEDKPFYIEWFTLTLADWPSLMPILSEGVQQEQEIVALDSSSPLIPDGLKDFGVDTWLVLKHRDCSIESSLSHLQQQRKLASLHKQGRLASWLREQAASAEPAPKTTQTE